MYNFPNSKMLKEINEVCPGVPFKQAFPQLDDDGIDLLRRMLQYDPTKRISAAEALNHPFFKEFHSDKKGQSKEQPKSNGQPNNPFDYV